MIQRTAAPAPRPDRERGFKSHPRHFYAKITILFQNNLIYHYFSSGFSARDDAPPIMPNMKPMMNPPPVITLGIENTIIIMPHTFLFAGLLWSIIAPSNTRAPKINPRAVRRYRTVASLANHGIVGITQGNQVVAAPTSVVLHSMRIPAIRDKVKALVGFSLRLITSHHIVFRCHFYSVYSRAFFASSLVQLRISSQSRKS